MGVLFGFVGRHEVKNLYEPVVIPGERVTLDGLAPCHMLRYVLTLDRGSDANFRVRPRIHVQQTGGGGADIFSVPMGDLMLLPSDNKSVLRPEEILALPSQGMSADEFKALVLRRFFGPLVAQRCSLVLLWRGEESGAGQLVFSFSSDQDDYCCNTVVPFDDAMRCWFKRVASQSVAA